MSFVYISIGNSDDKLTQKEWSEFCAEVDGNLGVMAQKHGVWFSAPQSQWQNACWCFEVQDDWVPALKTILARLARHYKQEWISWVQVSEAGRIEANKE
jgi:hypothetical protein